MQSRVHVKQNKDSLMADQEQQLADRLLFNIESDRIILDSQYCFYFDHVTRQDIQDKDVPLTTLSDENRLLLIHPISSFQAGSWITGQLGQLYGLLAGSRFQVTFHWLAFYHQVYDLYQQSFVSQLVDVTMSLEDLVQLVTRWNAPTSCPHYLLSVCLDNGEKVYRMNWIMLDGRFLDDLLLEKVYGLFFDQIKYQDPVSKVLKACLVPRA